jgi:threonine/homoserine/homoserine lactone efflux protein
LLGNLLLIIPFGIAGALSPMMLTEQTVVLTMADGRRAATRYAIGAIAVLVVFVSALVFFGRAISLPTEPSLSATLDILIGLILLMSGVALQLLERRRREIVIEGARSSGPRPAFGPARALGFGAFSMATNFTTLAVVIPAAKLIATSESVLPGRVALSTVLIVMASTPAWLPVVLTALAPGSAERGLNALGSLIQRRGRQLVAVLLVLLGTYLVIRGVFGVAGL